MDGELSGVLLVGALLLLSGVAAVRLSERMGVPSLLLYLLMGLAAGEAGLGIRFDDEQLAHDLGIIGLVIILAEGGLNTPLAAFRRSLPFALPLATVGVAVTTAVTALAAHHLFGMGWTVALLVGGITASTDAAAVFASVRTLPLHRRVREVLEGESGLNDPVALVLVGSISTGAWRADGIGLTVLLAVVELLGGAGVGAAVGLAGAWYLRRTALPAAGLYPLATLALCVLAYAVSDVVHVSGLVAVYVAALLMGRPGLPHGRTTKAFAEGLGWAAQIGLFVMLGLLASPGRLGGALLPALGVGAVLLLVARPLAVVVACAPRLPAREQAFVAWAGLRGAVPIVFATIPVIEDVDGADRVFDVVFLLVLGLTAFQGASLRWAARRLRVGVDTATAPLPTESAPLDRAGLELVQLQVPVGSQLHGLTTDVLRLPRSARVVFVVRDGEALVPVAWTRIREGDDLVVVTRTTDRAELDRRFRALHRGGELAQWRGEQGEE